MNRINYHLSRVLARYYEKLGLDSTLKFRYEYHKNYVNSYEAEHR